MPERFPYPIIASDADIDELGHVSNQVYLRWVVEAASAHSIARGWGTAEYKALGSGWVVRRHELDYLMQVTAGQKLVAETWVDSWKAASCVRKTEIKRDDGVVVLRASTIWAFMSFTTGRPGRIADAVLESFRDSLT